MWHYVFDFPSTTLVCLVKILITAFKSMYDFLQKFIAPDNRNGQSLADTGQKMRFSFEGFFAS